MIIGGSSRLVERIDEEGAVLRCKVTADQIPERGEALGPYVREPEAKVDNIVLAIGSPGEDVVLDIADLVVFDALLVEGEDFRYGIEGGGVRQQAFGPQAGTAGEFEDIAFWSEGVESVGDGCDIGEPFFVAFGAVIEAALAEEPLVVFASAGAVVGDLVLDYVGVFHSV